MKDSFEFNDFKYKVILNGDDIQFLLDYPDKYKLSSDTLYKYYNLKAHNIDSLFNNYLYACHPKELNDFYDMSGELIDYSKLDEKTIKDFIVKHDTEFLKKNFNKEVLERYYSELIQIIRFGKFGTISFSERFDNILMWAYYGNHQGFCVGYKYSDFQTNDLFGPFPINYTKNLTKIDFSHYLEPLCFQYQTNVKYKGWKHEQEYRYVAFNGKGLYDPDFFKHDKGMRKHKINSKSVIEIILGYNFFNTKELNDNDNIVKFDTNNPDSYNKIVLLNHIYNHKIDCFRVYYNKMEFKLAKRGVILTPIGTNEYKIEYDSIIHFYEDK